MTDIQASVIAFANQRELTVAKDAVRALHNAVNLKHTLGLPVLPETRQAILELEDEIASLKLELLRSLHPEQMTLPGMEGLVAKESEVEANAS